MVSRNELCPCGSGKKHKKCCGEAASSRSTRGLMLLVVPLALLAALGVYSAMSGSDGQASATSAGRVWSAEHGHWHDAPAPATRTQRPLAPAADSQPAPVSQPQQAAAPGSPQPGPAPAGQVWSAEHGHWHDANPQTQSPIQIEMADGAPASAIQSSGSDVRIDANALAAALPARKGAPQPAGEAPEGKIWSPEHGHWHDATAPQLPVQMGTVNRPTEPITEPPVPTPPGKVWSPEHGHFHDAPSTAGPRAPATTTAPNPE